MNILFTIPFTRKYARKWDVLSDLDIVGVWVLKCRLKLTRIHFGWVLVKPDYIPPCLRYPLGCDYEYA